MDSCFRDERGFPGKLVAYAEHLRPKKDLPLRQSDLQLRQVRDDRRLDT